MSGHCPWSCWMFLAEITPALYSNVTIHFHEYCPKTASNSCQFFQVGSFVNCKLEFWVRSCRSITKNEDHYWYWSRTIEPPLLASLPLCKWAFFLYSTAGNVMGASNLLLLSMKFLSLSFLHPPWLVTCENKPCCFCYYMAAVPLLQCSRPSHEKQALSTPTGATCKYELVLKRKGCRFAVAAQDYNCRKRKPSPLPYRIINCMSDPSYPLDRPIQYSPYPTHLLTLLPPSSPPPIFHEPIHFQCLSSIWVLFT